MGPLPEYLKLQRTSGPANEEQIVVVEGYPFYVGALFYLGRVGDSGDLMQDYSEEVCRVGFRALARGPGTVPVWVSQYGGNDPWILAGFFHYVTDEAPHCVQPGYPCDWGPTCCQTAAVPMACRAGRCQEL